MNPIVFPDVEDLLVQYLTVELPKYGRAVPVSVAVPEIRPSEFVLVPRTGGTNATLVSDAASIGVECWADTDAAALSLAQLTRGVLRALSGRMVDGVPFYRVDELAGPALLPDGVSQQARYVFAVSVHARGREVTPLS